MSSQGRIFRRVNKADDTLMTIRPTAIVALNRAIAVGQRDGAAAGLKEVNAIFDRERLDRYSFYHATLGEFELQLGNRETAREHFRRAASFARNSTERQFLE